MRHGLAACAAVVVLAGCGGDEPVAEPASGGAPTSSPSTPPGPPSATGPLYREPASLCAAADLRPLTELYPQVLDPIGDGPGLCRITLKSRDASLVASLDSNTFPEPSNAYYGYRGFRGDTEAYSDIQGVGTAAGWAPKDQGIWFMAYDRNVLLIIDIKHTDPRRKLPADAPEHVARVAAGTFARLPS
ncbi:hypothetical protein RB614_24995 [Phytohabitans sp. ZYX-F-186]|uniref:DUF3558 domain-containing protein n=1 Tax=Phytohabitans maris TaxID=3071409 RepID=A0ABU0ZL61_9ACTN|nr:hypothetical protein [Phytohabitans sp. ZYX-F-186]MDQ7907783.1 hypothetical protein [Phytohabitans sp. ZYX-F-186]